MARAKARTWLILVAGLIAGATARPLFAGAATEPEPAGDEQGTADAVRTPGGAPLAAVAEALRRGDYDRAAALLGQAGATLAPEDRSEFARLGDALAVAVQARRAGAQQIRLAEEAARDGQDARAADLLRHATVNEPYLTGEDRQRLARLTQKVRARSPDAEKPGEAVTTAAPGGALATARARAKLQEARAQMAQFNFERAEHLARAAEALKPKLSYGEDSPKKVLDDLARVRTDPKALLTAARVALGRKDYDRAERFAKESEKNAGPFTFPFWADNPSRVLKDVQALRGRTPPAGSKPAVATAAAPAKPATPAPKAAPPADRGVVQASATETAKPAGDPAVTPGSPAATERAVLLIKQARQALAVGDAAKAKKLNDRARALKPDLHWWDDNPEKVQADITRAELKSAASPKAAAAAPKAVDKHKPQSKEEAVALVKKGRALLAENKIDEAAKECLKARAMTSLSWGLFEDTPDKLHQDVEKARTKRDREESVKVLAEARKLYEDGKYKEAEAAAFRAQKLHGAYNMWELGDRPERVLADIRAAQIRIAKGQQVQTVRKDAGKKPAESTAQAPKPGAPADARQAKARETLTEARAALAAGDTARARKLAEQVRAMHVTLNLPGDDTPEAVLRDARAGSVAHNATPAPAPADSNRLAAVDGKAQAVRLMAEASELQKHQRLLEAREKAVAAQQVHATFSADEDSPEAMILRLTAEARWQAEWLVHDATRDAGRGGPDAAQRQRKAEKELAQALALAEGFGLDTRPVAAELARVRGEAAAPGGPAPATAVAAAPANHGEELLEKARLEIQRGDTATARRLAEEAARGPYGVQAEALAVLRSIGAEEFNQRRLQSNRTFDAALAAYNRRDFANAASLVQAIDPRDLDESRRTRLREIAMTPEMHPAAPQAPITQVQATGQAGLPAVPAPPAPAPVLGEQPGVAHAGDASPGDALLSQTEAMRQVKFQALRQQGLEVQREASEKFRTGQTDAAIELLQDYLARLNDAQLDLNQVALLKRPVESRMSQFKLLKVQRELLAEQDGATKRFKDAKSREALMEQNKQKQVASLMKQYNTLFKEGKYPEAERLALQAHELDPDNPMAAAAVSIARQQYRVTKVKETQSDKEKLSWGALNDTDDVGPADLLEKGGISMDRPTMEANKKRGDKYLGISADHKTERERDIERRLATPVTLNFNGAPLKSVIDDLQAWQGINIYVDENALQEDGISLDRPVSIKLEQIPMKSALNLLLDGSHLAWIIKDDVLRITTPRRAKGGLRTVTYPVADLVIPVNDFGQLKGPVSSVQPNIDTPRTPAGAAALTPVTGPRSLAGGDSVGSPTGGSAFGSESNGASPGWTKKGASGTTEEALMGLIKNTVAPQTWADSAGPGTIDYFPLNMSLVINQTQDIQEQVAELLASLRRLQDQEVAVEVRFITIQDSFFERIGVDFNMNIVTKNFNLEPQLTSGAFAPDQFINVFQPHNAIIGLQPAGGTGSVGGVFTPDLNIPINVQSFAQAVPSFGGYQPIPGFGGLTLGLAFLSDIQVFLFLEAVQGDVRSNVMQAPKLSMFNGQTASLTVQDSQPFVTGVQLTPQNGQLTFLPQTQVFNFGVSITMQAVITADRRFVRLSLAPQLTNLGSPVVTLFPVVVPIFPQLDLNIGTGQPVILTQFIQQPTTSNVTVQTTVAVPDGGTVLMGGLKLLNEERKEYGPPILSKIPILSRLFKNTAYGRDAQSLLIMVTPRIIIMEEEEEKQTGYVRPPVPTF